MYGHTTGWEADLNYMSSIEPMPDINEDGFYYFARAEFDCFHTGKNEIEDHFVHKLDQLRYNCGFPFRILSGYRDKTHPAEEAKERPGTHTKGIAADIAVTGGDQRRKIVETALALGFSGVGVAKTFVHIDVRSTFPVLWNY